MIDINFESSINEVDYNSLMNNSLEINFYYKLEWHNVLKKTFNLELNYLTIYENKKIKGALAFCQVSSFVKGKRLISLPLSHQVPLLAIEKKYLHLALNKINELSSKFNYIELKGVESFSKDRLNNTSFYRSENLTNCIELNKFASYNNYLSSLSSNVRRKVNKATSIFEIITDKNLETFEHLARLISYSKLKHGAPVYPEEFLINIYNLVPKDNYDIYLGKYNNEFISAIIIFKFNGHHIYYTGGSIQDHESSKYYCNYLLFNKAIENAFNQRAKIFDFGTSPKNHHSLIELKKMAPCY